MATESSIFYDPFANRADKFDALDRLDSVSKFDSKFTKEKESKRDVAGSDSNNGDDSPNEVDDDELCDDFPSAPPMDILDRIQGYEMVSFDSMHVPPPPHEPEIEDEDDGKNSVEEKCIDPGEAGNASAKQQKEKPEPKIVFVQEMETKLTEQQARSALLTHLSHHCCYGTAAAKSMIIKTLEYLPAYHYELQTFTEKRETAWTYSHLRHGYDGLIQTPLTSLGGLPPPLPWEIQEDPGQLFKDEVRLTEVPRTESAKTCHRCRGTGGVVCRDCNGKGWCRCLHCHGDGWMSDSSGHKERCFYCQHSRNGHGQQDCNKCHTKGKVNCQICEGHGQIRCYIQLSITWKVYTAEHIVERLKLPRDLIRDVSGQVVFEEEGIRVQPVDLDSAFSASTNEESQSALIKSASESLVNNHINTFSVDRKVVQQRHQVRVVPVTRVTYEWKSKPYEFYVYGYENKVHLPNYPQSCCWGCQIL